MNEDFVKLCLELRKLGCTHVKHGAYEASFSGTLVSTPAVVKPSRPSTPEERAAVLERSRADELSRV